MKTKPIVYLLKSLIVFCLLITVVQCRSNATTQVKTTPVNLDLENLGDALEWAGEIGGGRNFLTLMVDLPQPLPEGHELFALALDRDQIPIRKISGYTFNPELKGKNHLWFYLFLFGPGGPRHELRSTGVPAAPSKSYTGDYIKFILVKGNETIMEKVVRRYDEWGNDTTPLIIDMPPPPQEIPGYLELKDYTFFARGDYRKPEGYFVEGKIIGGPGTWNYFTPTSDIQGREPEPQVKLPTSQGWLELSTGKTHQMMEAVSPVKPYVNGWWDGKGYFHPQPAKIQ